MTSNGWLSVDYRIFDPIISMLEPDTLTSYQYLDRWRSAGHLEPERRLMLAVLQEAVDCYQENVFQRGRKQEELYKDAEAWLFSDDRELLFSFLNLCEILGFDADYLRSGLMRWRDHEISLCSKPVTAPIDRKTPASIPRKLLFRQPLASK